MVKRKYVSPRRRQQAEQTREAILTAARRLFVERGYAATTVEAIAAEAGVATQTVYATLGSKKSMLIALLDRMAADADPARMQRAIAAAGTDAGRQLREVLKFTSRFFSAGRDLIELARTVSGVEPDLAAMWRTGERRRHRAVGKLVRAWARAGALADGVTVSAATDSLWALAGPDVFRLLVVERGWGEERRIEAIARMLEGVLLAHRPSGASRPRPDRE